MFDRFPVRQPREGSDRQATPHVRELERELHTQRTLASLATGSLPSWTVDAVWSAVPHCNGAARAALGLTAPVLASDLLAVVHPDDVTLLGHLTGHGGYATVRFRVGERLLHFACMAVPRRNPHGAVTETAFLAADASDEAARAEDQILAVSLALQLVDQGADHAWTAVCRELRHACGARSVTVVAVDEPEAVLALDPPASRRSSSLNAVNRSLNQGRALSGTCFAVPAGNHHAVLVEGPGNAGVVLADGTRARGVLDQLAWRIETEQSLRAELDEARRELAMLRPALVERDRALAAAESAERARISATATAEAAFNQLADLSHELRNALNTICGFAQLLAAQDLADSHARAVHHIGVAGSHLTTLLDGVLELVRADGARDEMALVPTDLRTVVDDAIALSHAVLEENDVDVEARSTADPVLAEARALRQVLVNLISNAAKYGRSPGHVVVSASRRGPLVRVEVADDGPGIAPEQAATLFSRFDRGGLSRWDQRGVGLGLALCQRLVERMHGTIGVESVVGSGSVFWFELPAASDATAGTGTVTGTRTVAVTARDDATIELIHAVVASSDNVIVSPSRSAWATIELLRSTPVDAVVVDADVDDAEELITFGQRLDGRPRIVVLRSGGAQGFRGVDAELTKPFDLDVLRRALRLDGLR